MKTDAQPLLIYCSAGEAKEEARGINEGGDKGEVESTGNEGGRRSKGEKVR